MVDVITAPDALVQHCRRAKKSEATSSATGSRDYFDVKALVEWLNEREEFSHHDQWVNLGMSLRLEYGDSGIDIWRVAHDETVTEAIETSKWNSFATIPDPGCFTLNSLFLRAHQLGWTGTIRPSIGSMFGGIAQIAPFVTVSKKNYLRTVGDCIRNFVPPDYLVDGILQRRFCYSLTAQTGVGKTTVAMLLAAHVATGKSLGGVDVERGTVLYLAGENPTDVTMRWMGLCKEMGLDPETIDVHIIEGTKRFSEEAGAITQEIIDAGLSLALVIVDTAAAYFEGDNDNDNVQAGNHARMLRSLTLLPGGPCVLVLCHPTKNATDDNIVPRGGGAFLAEVDGNISLLKNESTLAAFALGKFRGPEFTPLNFGLKVIRDHPLLVDTRGRQIPTIVAVPISAAEHERVQERASNDEDKVLRALCDNPGMKNSDVGKVMGGWHREKTRRSLSRLAEQGLATSTKDYWTATPKGQKYLNTVATAQPVQTLPVLAPTVLGPSGVVTPTRFVKPPPMPPVPS